MWLLYALHLVYRLLVETTKLSGGPRRPTHLKVSVLEETTRRDFSTLKCMGSRRDLHLYFFAFVTFFIYFCSIDFFFL